HTAVIELNMINKSQSLPLLFITLNRPVTNPAMAQIKAKYHFCFRQSQGTHTHTHTTLSHRHTHTHTHPKCHPGAVRKEHSDPDNEREKKKNSPTMKINVRCKRNVSTP